MKKKKRGAIEVQFNWIFILIIGAIILIFFFGIVRTQKQVSEKKISTTVRRDIGAILTGAGVSTGTTSLVEIPKLEIDYDCEGYSIEKTNPIKPIVSFSPNSINDIRLMLWALDWNIGYRITNFLYITSPNIRYILVFKDNDQKKFVDIINETLPPRYIDEEKDIKILMNKEKMELDSNDNFIGLEDKNDYKVRFVFFDEEPEGLNINELEKMEDEDVTAIKIEQDSNCGDNLDCFGELKFYKKNNNVFGSSYGDSPYIKLPSLIGAIFSDLETYNCDMENAFKRLQLVTEIYLDKTKVLKEYYTETFNHQCLTSINEIETVLQNILNYSNDFNEYNNIKNLYTEINNLEDLNDIAIKLSCAEIY